MCYDIQRWRLGPAWLHTLSVRWRRGFEGGRQIWLGPLCNFKQGGILLPNANKAVGKV